MIMVSRCTVEVESSVENVVEVQFNQQAVGSLKFLCENNVITILAFYSAGIFVVLSH